jgi:hypothetical protein
MIFKERLRVKPKTNETWKFRKLQILEINIYVSLQTWHCKGLRCCGKESVKVVKSTVMGREVLVTFITELEALTDFEAAESAPVWFSLFLAGVIVMLGLLKSEATDGV